MDERFAHPDHGWGDLLNNDEPGAPAVPVASPAQPPNRTAPFMAAALRAMEEFPFDDLERVFAHELRSNPENYVPPGVAETTDPAVMEWAIRVLRTRWRVRQLLGTFLAGVAIDRHELRQALS